MKVKKIASVFTVRIAVAICCLNCLLLIRVEIGKKLLCSLSSAQSVS